MGQETSRKIYQGSEATGTLLRTINTLWAANGTPSVRTTILEDGISQAKTETDFDTNGNLLALREYGWGNGQPGWLMRNTTFSYATFPSNPFIKNRISGKAMRDVTGTIKSNIVIDYDGMAPRLLRAPTASPEQPSTTTPIMGAHSPGEGIRQRSRLTKIQ